MQGFCSGKGLLQDEFLTTTMKDDLQDSTLAGIQTNLSLTGNSFSAKFTIESTERHLHLNTDEKLEVMTYKRQETDLHKNLLLADKISV